MMRPFQMRAGWLVLVGSLASMAASAQTPALQLRAGSDLSDTYLLGPGDCNLGLRVTWQYVTNVGVLCTPLKLWSTEGECGEAPGTDDVRYDDVTATTVSGTRSGTFTVQIADLPGFKSGSTTPCGEANMTKTHKVCGVIEYSVSSCGYTTQPKLQASALKIVYDTLPPSRPQITNSSAIDGAARIGFSVDSDTLYVLAEVRAQGDANFTSAGEVVATANSIQVDGLVNGTTYDVQLKARDAAGNVSEASDSVAVTPIKTIGFWGVYKDKGGTETGGCSATPGLLPAGLLLVPWWRRRRGRRG